MTDKLAEDGLIAWVDACEQAAATGSNTELTIKDFEAAWSPRFAADEIDALVISKRTHARRKAKAETFSAEEQDRAFRLAQIQIYADRVFANPEKSSRWLRTPNNRLSRQTPLDVLKSAAGAALVMEMLGQIDHGIYV
jgi:putative toxin-antitoxin system antitoxin component (TIGR02293 family)